MIRAAVIGIIFVLVAGGIAFAGPVSSDALIGSPRKYDMEVVEYRGEIIGDIMTRGDHAWLSVSDGNNAIGVWTKKELLKDIKFAGDYKKKGDIVTVKGVFHRACVEHGGDLDIHALSMDLAKRGYFIPRPVQAEKVFYSAVFSAVTLCLALLCLIKSVRTARKK
ncbi:MAG: DNA-binding protein [Candidatus Omnitrophota bacterium]